MIESDKAAPSKPNRKPFYLVLALFFAPLLLAFIVYYGSDWRPSRTTNKGDLITPVIALPSVMLSKADGGKTDEKFLRGDWTLVYVAANGCDEVCRNALMGTANVRQLLGKDLTRVSRALLYTGQLDVQALPAEQSDLLSANLDDAAGQALLALFPARHAVTALDAKAIYIVDPLGNLMMRYAPGADPRWIYQDLKKLLALSHIG